MDPAPWREVMKFYVVLGVIVALALVRVKYPPTRAGTNATSEAVTKPPATIPTVRDAGLPPPSSPGVDAASATKVVDAGP